MVNLDEIKPTIRAILMALGSRATEREFRNEYYNQEGDSFNTVLRELGMTFLEFMREFPDACRAFRVGEDVIVEKVSDENSRHMDKLTVGKKKRVMSKFSSRQSSYDPRRVTLGAVGKLNARYVTHHHKAQQASYVKKPMVAPHNKAVVPPKTMAQYREERAKLKALPPAPHMLAKPISFKKEEDIRTDEEKSCNETRPAAPITNVSKPSEDKENKKSALNSWNPFKAALDDIKVQKKADLGKQSAQMPSPLREIKTEAQTRLKSVVHPVTNYQPITTNTAAPSPRTPVNNELAQRVQSIVHPVPNYQPISFNMNLAAPVLNVTRPAPMHPPISSNLNATASATQAPKSHQSVQSRLKVASTQSQDNESIAKLRGNPSAIKKLEADIMKRQEEISQMKKALAIKAAQESISRTKSNVEPIDWEATSIEPVSFPKVKELRGTRIFEVALVEINSPSQFVFQYKQKELLAMTTEMTIYYNNLNGSKKIPPNALKSGQTVAYFYGSKWHRVEIVCISENDVYINFIDIGFNHRAKVNDFSYLTKEFAASTRKACKGCLHGVKPLSGALWSPEAIMAFMTKTRGHKLMATVKAVADKTFELSLIYNGMQNLTVEDYLLGRKIAQPSRDYKPVMDGILF